MPSVELRHCCASRVKNSAPRPSLLQRPVAKHPPHGPVACQPPARRYGADQRRVANEGSDEAGGRLSTRVPRYPHDYGDAMNWTAELPIVWIVDGRRVPGRVAIGVPELVPDGDGESICAVVLDGLQPMTPVHGDGEFHALMQGVRFLDLRIRDYVAKGFAPCSPAKTMIQRALPRASSRCSGRSAETPSSTPK